MTPKYPTRFQSKTIWRALTGIAILVIGILIVGLIWLAGKTLGYLQPVLVPLAVAGIVAYLLDPIVTWLQHRGLSRIKAVIYGIRFLYHYPYGSWLSHCPAHRQAGLRRFPRQRGNSSQGNDSHD